MPSGLGFKNPEQLVLTVVVLFFTVLFVTAWLTAVGGVGKLDKDCDSNGCKSEFRDQWWALFFELLTYVFMFGTMLTGTLDSARGAVLTFLALTAVNTEDLAEKYLDFRDGNDRGLLDLEEDAINAGIAGFILLTMCNFVFILVVGINADLAQAVERLKTFKQRWQTPQQPQQPQQPHMQQFPHPQQPVPMPVGKPDAPYAVAPGQMPPPNMPPPNMPPPNMPPPNMPPPNMPPPNMPPPNMPPPNVPP